MAYTRFLCSNQLAVRFGFHLGVSLVGLLSNLLADPSSSLHARLTGMACWMLLHIWPTPRLANPIREEIKPCVKITQRPQIGGISQPLQIAIKFQRLSSCCPLLKACLCECTRLHCSPIKIASVEKSLIATTEDGKGEGHRQPKAITLDAGSWIVDASGVIASGSDGLGAFMPERRLINDAEAIKAGGGEIRQSPSNADDFTGDNAVDVNIEVCALVAGILAVWDVHPLHSQDLEISKPSTSSPISRPGSVSRASISQRSSLD